MYQRFHQELGDTGHELIESNREGEIMASTPIYNVWRMFTDTLACIYYTNLLAEQMERKFKWYKCLHALLSTSPVHNHSGLANSTSPINLNILLHGDKLVGLNDGDLEEGDAVNEQRNDVVSIWPSPYPNLSQSMILTFLALARTCPMMRIVFTSVDPPHHGMMKK